jgi:hypothetical protein
MTGKLRRINPRILHRAEFYTERMDIPLTWVDLVKLASNGKVEKDGNTLSVSRAILPDLQISADGLRGFVRFTVDESNPLSTPQKFARMQGFPELNLTRENAPAVLRELQAKRQSLSDNDPGLPKIIVQIAWVKKYLEASLLTAGLSG